MQLSHPLANSWKQGQPTLNGWLSLANSFSAEIMAAQGFDSITIDMQHGVSDYSSIIAMLAAIQKNGTTALARVPWLDAGNIMKTLDAGVSGIICPMINNKQDAEKLVQYAYYPPIGGRSFGPIRAKLCYEGDYASQAAEKLLIIAMIETQEAIDNLDDILSVDEIDAIYIGPADLSLNLGEIPKFDQDSEKVVNAIKYILDKAKQYGKYAGIHNGSVSYAQRMAELGFNFVTVGSDAVFMAQGASKTVSDFHANKKSNNTEKPADY